MISKPKLIILGAGGHAKVLIDALIEAKLLSHWEFVILTPNRYLHGQTLLGMPILGDDDEIPQQIRMGATHFMVGVGSIGSSTLRQRLYTLGLHHHLLPMPIIHPRAICSTFAELGAGSQILAGSIINAHVTLGHNVIINTGAIVEHDCKIGAHVHIAPGARLLGEVTVDAGAHIGAGACIRQGLHIGENAVVGMGAVVVKNVLAETTVIGIPAKRIIAKP